MEENKFNAYVRVFGNENELKRLHHFLDSPNCTLGKLKDAEGCYLTSCRFSNLTAAEVHESAERLITMIKAFAKLELGGDFQSINIGSGKIVVDNENVAAIITRGDGWQSVALTLPALKGVAASAGSVEVTGNGLVKTSGTEPSERKEHLHGYYLNRCDDEINSNVLDALYYFAQETSFYSLYKIYEIIKRDVDGHKDPTKGKLLQWTTFDKIMDFKDSAHCYDAVRRRGLYGGRHARVECEQQKLERIAQGKKIRSGSILDLQEAESFIRCLLKKWLNWKRYRATA
ncbi:MAG: hypothetical protein ABR979_01835 [Halobacteriota archaeon]|jgi:hypothetical protein